MAWPMDKSQKEKNLQNYLCKSMKFFLKSSQANGRLFNFHPQKKLFCRFFLF